MLLASRANTLPISLAAARDPLPQPILAEYTAFLEENVEFLELTRARATSYWNAYARSEFPKLREYPALRVLERIAFWMSP